MSRSRSLLIAAGLFFLGCLAGTPFAQSTVGNFSRIFINGNRLEFQAGTNIFRFPNATGTPPICTSTTLTNDQIIHLPTTAITLVSAPASSYRIHVLSLSLATNTSAGAYSGINGTYADLHTVTGLYYATYGPVDDSTAVPAMTVITQILGTTAQTIYDVTIPNLSYDDGYIQSLAVSGTESYGAALQIAMDNNGSGILGSGNAANTMKASYCYVLEGR